MGWLDLLKPGRLGRRRREPVRDSIQWPALFQSNNTVNTKRLAYRSTPRNLRWFSRTPYARRAINTIKNPIAQLDWEIVAKTGVDMNSELENQIEVATYCLNHPNHDDSFRTLVEQVIEDLLLGAGGLEMQLSSDPLRPLWLWPVDGLTIQIFPGWTPGSKAARYVQIVGYGNFAGSSGSQTLLTDDELIYIRPNPSSATPFGVGPLEIAFNSISRMLGVGEFAGNVATNARPSVALELGEGYAGDTLSAFRAWWRNEVEGQGQMPIWAMQTTGPDGKTRGPSVHRLYPEGDGALYLKYQEFLKTEIAMGFDIAPQEMGVERDVNRNTAEVGEDRTRNQAVKPWARLLASHITRHALHRGLGFSQLEFRYVGLDQEDELNLAKVYQIEYAANGLTPNEYRARRGMPSSDNPFSNMLFADVQIAMQAARGSAQVDDPDLKPNPGDVPPAKPQPKRKAQ